MPTVAIIGASPDRRKFGNKSVRAHMAAGWTVFPVHPTEQLVEGIQAYANVNDIPAASLDRISVYLPPPVILKVADSWTAKPVKEVWLNPGADTPDAVAKCKGLGMTVVTACSIVDAGFSPSQFADT